MRKPKQKSLKRRMNRTAILQFYKHRELPGDNSRLSFQTGLSESQISNVKAGRRSITAGYTGNVLPNAMYYLARRRKKQEEFA